MLRFAKASILRLARSPKRWASARQPSGSCRLKNAHWRAGSQLNSALALTPFLLAELPSSAILPAPDPRYDDRRIVCRASQ